MVIFRALSGLVTLPYAQRMATKSEVTKSETDDGDAAQPPLFSRSTVAPAAGVGLVVAILATQEHAPLPVAAIVAVAVTLVVIGMIALKRAFRGD